MLCNLIIEVAQALADQIIDLGLGRCMVHLFNLFFSLIVGFAVLAVLLPSSTMGHLNYAWAASPMPKLGILAFRNQHVNAKQLE